MSRSGPGLSMDHQSSRASGLSGWRLFVFLVAIPISMAGNAALFHRDVDGLRTVIILTVRYTLVLFCLTFSSSALQRLWPNDAFRWLLRNRRVMGLAFAASHSVHIVGLAVFALIAPASYARESRLFSEIVGTIGYLFVLAMAITSFDVTRAWVGEARWRILHSAGGYCVWGVFAYMFGKRSLAHPSVPLYIVALFLLLLCLALRLIARESRRRARGVLPTVASPDRKG
jgi:methionine sulfoxide reductase heme-binding subunit